MNDPNDDIGKPNDDSILEELLSPLKQLEPSFAGRLANRRAVADELHAVASASRNRSLPWWRRTIRIPAALVAGSVAAAVLIAVACYRFGSEQSHPQFVQPERSSVSVAPNPPVGFYETETYLCGFGRLNSVSGYFLQDKFHDQQTN